MISWEIPMKFEIFFTWYRLIEECKLGLKTKNDYECQWIMMFMIYIYTMYYDVCDIMIYTLSMIWSASWYVPLDLIFF